MTWPGYSKWKYQKTQENEGMKAYEAFEKTIGADRLVDVYVDLDPDANFDSTPTNSFKKETLTKMKYSEFL